jgi:hypothetical protein
VDWCERNYVDNRYVAEMWNCLSSLPISAIAFYGMIISLRHELGSCGIPEFPIYWPGSSVAVCCCAAAKRGTSPRLQWWQASTRHPVSVRALVAAFRFCFIWEGSHFWDCGSSSLGVCCCCLCGCLCVDCACHQDGLALLMQQSPWPMHGCCEKYNACVHMAAARRQPNSMKVFPRAYPLGSDIVKIN